MRLHRFVQFVGSCALIFGIFQETGFSFQQQSARSIPHFEIDPAKYKLAAQQTKKSSLTDSMQADTLANSIKQSPAIVPARRRRFANLHVPALDAANHVKMQQAETVAAQPAGKDFPDVLPLSDSSLASTNNEVSRQATTAHDSSNSAPNPQPHASSRSSTSTQYIPWEALSSVTSDEPIQSRQDSTNVPAGNAPTLIERIAFLFKPGVVRSAEICLVVVSSLFAVIFLVPSARARFYFIFGNYRGTIRACEKLAAKKPHDTALHTMLAFAYFSCDADPQKARKVYEATQILQASTGRQNGNGIAKKAKNSRPDDRENKHTSQAFDAALTKAEHANLT